jgi:phage-related minor tail protein
LIAAIQTQNRVESLERRLDITGRIAQRTSDLNLLLEQQPQLAEEINEAFEKMELRSLEASTALEDGFTRAFIKIRNEAEDLAAVGEAVVNTFADNATDALVEFAQTGKLSFKDLANSIVNDLIKIIARLLVVQALSALPIGGGGAAGGLAGAASSFGGARAEGGTVQPGRSFLVGENGPETFIPDRTGTIAPAKGQNVEPPVTNVQVINVSDPDEVPNNIESGASDQAILNVIARHPDKVKQVL